MSSERYFAGGISHLWGLCTFFGSQLGHANMSLARLVMVSDMAHHKGGHGAPPNMTQRATNAMLSWHVQLAAAECPHSVIFLYAAEKSYLLMMIGVFGRWNLKLCM